MVEKNTLTAEKNNGKRTFSLLGGCSAVVRAATVSAVFIWAYNRVPKRPPGFTAKCKAKCKGNAKDVRGEYKAKCK